MPEETSARIKELPRLSKPKLVTLWRELFAASPHPKLRRTLMIPILAYQIQEQAYGGLKACTRRRLKKLAEELEQNRKAPLVNKPHLRTGTKLLRRWQGQMYEVLVVEEHFEYRGKRYTSLSEIARQITGTRWSGPAFFGLKPVRRETMK